MLTLDIPDTQGADKYQKMMIGKIIIEQPGEVSLKLVPGTIASGNLMNLQSIALNRASGSSTVVSGPQWDFRFPSHDLRYVRMMFNEFIGESVAVNHVEVGGERKEDLYIPTSEDVLALATNQKLEIASGDTVTANYTDELTQNESGTSQLLNTKLTATYNNATITPITYAFTRGGSGQVQETRLNLMLSLIHI